MAGNPDITILLTRPRAQSIKFATTLKQRFAIRARIAISPLLEIAPLKAAIELTGVHYIIFTSVNGVRAFMPQIKCRGIPVLCVGHKTADIARKAGFKVMKVAPTAEALLALAISCGPGKTFLYVRGRETAKQIALNLNQSGNTALEAIVYEQLPLTLNPEYQLMLQAGNPVILPLFSPRTAEVFQACATGLDLQNTTAICISQNTADKLAHARFQAVLIARQPTADAIAREIAAII